MLAPNSLLAQAVICLLNLHLLVVSLPSTQHRLEFESYQMCVLQRSQRYLAFIGPTSAVEDVWADRLEQTLRDSMDSCCHGSLIVENRMCVLFLLFLFVFIERTAGSLGMEAQVCHLSIWEAETGGFPCVRGQPGYLVRSV